MMIFHVCMTKADRATLRAAGLSVVNFHCDAIEFHAISCMRNCSRYAQHHNSSARYEQALLTS